MVTAQPLACASARAAARMVATSVWLSTALLFISILLSSYFGCSLAGGGRWKFAWRDFHPTVSSLVVGWKTAQPFPPLPHRFLDHFDPVLDRCTPGTVQVGLAADVGGDD